MAHNPTDHGQKIQLGDGLAVSPLGFGGMALTPVYGEVDPAEALQTLHHALDAGVSFIDTADIYGGGSNEELISQLLKDRRDEVQLATKFALVGTPTDGYTDIRGDAAYVREAVERSLQRLGTDVIDLYYMHRRDVRVPIEETVGAMAELVKQGKVKHLGLSEVTAQELRDASAVHPISAVQSEWSIWSRDVERNVVPAAAELGVGFVPYSRWAVASSPAPWTPQAWAKMTSAGTSRASPRMPPAPTRRWWMPSGPWRTSSTPHRRRWPWPGCSPRASGSACPSSPSPAPGRLPGSMKNLGALALDLTPAHLEVLAAASDAVVGSRSANPAWVSEGRE